MILSVKQPIYSIQPDHNHKISKDNIFTVYNQITTTLTQADHNHNIFKNNILQHTAKPQ